MSARTVGEIFGEAATNEPVEELAKRIAMMDPHEKLVIASELLVAKRPHLALAIVRQVEGDLTLVLNIWGGDR